MEYKMNKLDIISNGMMGTSFSISILAPSFSRLSQILKWKRKHGKGGKLEPVDSQLHLLNLEEKLPESNNNIQNPNSFSQSYATYCLPYINQIHTK